MTPSPSTANCPLSSQSQMVLWQWAHWSAHPSFLMGFNPMGMERGFILVCRISGCSQLDLGCSQLGLCCHCPLRSPPPHSSIKFNPQQMSLMSPGAPSPPGDTQLSWEDPSCRIQPLIPPPVSKEKQPPVLSPPSSFLCRLFFSPSPPSIKQQICFQSNKTAVQPLEQMFSARLRAQGRRGDSH